MAAASAADSRTRDLVGQAQGVLAKADDPASLWRAYVAVEYAILDIKLRHGLEHEQSPPTAPKRTAKRDDLLAFAKEKLGRLDLEKGDRKKLLYELRECRDALKALLAKPS
ncbi:hypothetical protein NTE_00655 [Candidatus Nitrososphaera evergladensis SR1]|uniref:Uncharacterized protein n=1 Tax=Candidatus Nitrososphaera evergladensis SR1 TaxID=1459636 RepID=A0A075MNN7_9ARCH|nr:hypothetical protein [Candidatus Nitrososphaera evergladensis]AIF82735.1 hypothetical protein NTE_00655 [Candidatus Nitrososphaera evergladensis SR1]